MVERLGDLDFRKPLIAVPGRRIAASLHAGSARALTAALALLVLLLFLCCDGALPGLGRLVRLADIRPESGLAWTAPLGDPALDEDGRRLGAGLFEFQPGDGVEAWACRVAGPAVAPLCGRFWRTLGPGRQLHDTIRQQGGGRFSVWHGTLYFSLPAGEAPQDRILALWVPWPGLARGAAAASGAALLWVLWPLAKRPIRRQPRLLLGAAGLIAAAGAARLDPSLGLLVWAGLLLAGLELLPRLRHVRFGAGWCSAAVLALAGFAAAEAALAFALPRLGLVADLQQSQMLKYLVETKSDKPILLLVGSSLTQYGVDETALETALAAQGHQVTVLRLGFGGMSIPERLHYLRQYLAAARQPPAAVLFEVSGYYDLYPLQQLAQNPFSRREIAAMDLDNLRLSLAWLLGPEGEPAQRPKLAGTLLTDFALQALQIGVLPKSAWWTELEAKPFRLVPPKTKHDPDATIAAELALIEGEDTPTAPITAWARQAIDEETGLFRAAGIQRLGFYATPSRYASEWRYARNFCREERAYPCLPAEDPALLATLGQDQDWLDQTHLQGEGRARYTAWLAVRIAAAGVLP